jgi:plastocyanin
MQKSRSLFSLARRCDTQIFIAIVGGLIAGSAWAAGPYSISQKNREFQPGQISITRGEALRFINDDGELLHHAYLTSPTFQFDSGDQKPGSSYTIAFPVTGSFTVRCAIHPKMKLVVKVN